MDKPLVSVIMASYNCGQYIAEAINSALNQTYPNIEIIIVNDGSTDNTLEVLQQFEGKIRLINQENKGVASAKNAGIEAAQGEYIAFLDADDMLEPGYIETAVDYLMNGFDAISFNFYYTDENRNKLKTSQPIIISGFFVNSLNIFKELLALGFLVVKRHFLTTKAHDERLTFAEDYDMWLRLLRGKAAWFYHGTPMACYMLRQNSSCHTYREDIASQLWHIYQKHIDSIGMIKAWLYYRRHLAIYRYAMLKKALKTKQPKRIIKHAFIAAKSPFYVFNLRDFWFRVFSFNS